MSTDLAHARAEAHERANSVPLDAINLTDTALWASDSVLPYFERLRHEDPVHYHPSGQHPGGAYWSVTRFHDIVAVDSDHNNFSSSPNITLDDDFAPGFIAMDPPKHDVQRKAVTPSVSPGRLRDLEPLIRSRMQKCLDDLPVGEPFDWVDKVSIELTGQMLATLFDFPFENRRKLTYWSDMISADPTSPLYTPDNWQAEFQAVMDEAYSVFIGLWNERAGAEPRDDLISMMAHSPAMKDMSPEEYLGNLMLLIVGGNDTTRNSMTGSVYAMHRFPEQRAKLDRDAALLPSMISETIRWQTPLAYMRRTATRDVELGGKTIREGDKVAMWYLSGNRDETVIDRPNDYLIDRPNARRHLSFGFGIHRCVGNRLAELQLKILWEEIATRFPEIVVTAEPERVPNSFVRGYNSMQVVIPRRL
ncbi:cytochrome P450 [Sphingopyxis sp.]|uniref:cytochrome P450 n=1 Tax=Sphingopyxis sp. TaxID=1908224 RepID=UPI002D79BE81|nr:cytochrome P450 [Sphingopyxis sp.]HET6526731.1 cytochrome P450 [Sphingopyxis sp.]